MKWLCMAAFLGLAGCDESSGTEQANEGSWYEVTPPRDAPAGTKCMVWQYGILDNRMGGPYCYQPEEG